MKDLYTALEPYATHRLDVGGGHRLYVEEAGNPAGLPAVFLHGGPGSGCKPYHRCFFDPARYRAILFDQRGAGRSTPRGRLEANTTGDLLADIETIRTHLGVERWVLFGGSWGATLALLYAQWRPERVAGIVLRGTFLARRRDLDWYLGGGLERIYPERWEEFMATLHGAEGEDLIETIHGLLHGQDEVARRRVARAWIAWGGQAALGDAYSHAALEGHDYVDLLHQARIEAHYGFNRYFIDEDRILRDCHLIPEVPIVLLHGRRDLVCPVEAAHTLWKRLPGAELRILPTAGHIAGQPEMIDAMVRAADEMAERACP